MWPLCSTKALNTCSPSNSSNGTGFENANKASVVLQLYLIFIIATIGILGNFISFIVLHSDKERRNVHFLLKVLAFADTFYLIFAILRSPFKHVTTDAYYYFILQPIVYPLLKTAQLMSVWTTVLVTIDRYVHVKGSMRSKRIFSEKGRKLMAFFLFLATTGFAVPLYFDSCVMVHLDCNGPGYIMAIPNFRLKNEGHDIYNHTLLPIFLFFIPFILLSTFNTILLVVICKSRERRNSTPTTRNNFTAHLANRQQQINERSATVVLIAIVATFLVCETPETVHGFFAIIEIRMDATNVKTLRDVNELLMVVNCSLNFFLFLAFGRRFRSKLREIVQRRWPSSPFTQNTNVDGIKKRYRQNIPLLPRKVIML